MTPSWPVSPPDRFHLAFCSPCVFRRFRRKPREIRSSARFLRKFLSELFQSVRRIFGAAKVERTESTAQVSQVYDRSLVCSVFCPRGRLAKGKKIFREAKPRCYRPFVRPFHSNIPAFLIYIFVYTLVSHLRFCLPVCALQVCSLALPEYKHLSPKLRSSKFAFICEANASGQPNLWSLPEESYQLLDSSVLATKYVHRNLAAS